jgi:hypothetical protein
MSTSCAKNGLAALIAFAALVANIARAEFHAELVSIPISAAAVEDKPDLANAQVWQLRVTADNKILAMELYVQLAGATFFQHSFNGDYYPPNPQLLPVFPSVEFDSYLWMNGITSDYGPITNSDYLDLYDGPRGFSSTASHHWTSADNPPPVAAPFAQMTIVPDGNAPIGHSWLARFYERLGPGEIREHIVAFPAGLTSPFEADVNLDFTVDGDDLQMWSSSYGQSGDLAANLKHLDLDDDGDTDNIDCAILLSNLGNVGGPEDGDINGNGRVDNDDLKALLHFGMGHMWNPADVDQDKDVDGADFLRWQQQLGGGFTLPPPAAAATISEPATPPLLPLLMAALGVRAHHGSARPARVRRTRPLVRR